MQQVNKTITDYQLKKNHEMSEHQASHPDANDLEDNFLKNNSRKKTYAEAIQTNTMDESSYEEDEDELENHLDTERSTNQ